MKKLVRFLSLFIILVVFTIGCGKSDYLKDINYQKLNDKIDNKESFILEVVQTGCSNCTSFNPKFSSVLNEYKITAYSINLSNMNDNDKEKLLDEYEVDGTPTVIFFKKGKPTSNMKRLVGDNDKDTIIAKLKQNGYIKD